MNQELTTVAWHGLELRAASAEGAQTVASLLRRSRFALVAAERAHELPAAIASAPVVANRLQASSDLMPRLVNLEALSIAQHGELLATLVLQQARGEQSLIAALLDSTASSAVMAAHLRQAQARSQGAQVGWLRLHDPYVFIQLPRVLGLASLSGLLGPVRSWAICLGGHWWWARVQASPVSAPPQVPIDARMRWEGLLRIAAVNRALRQLQALTLKQIIELSGHLDILTMCAEKRHGLTKVADQAAFAALGADLRQDFDEHPEVAVAIATNRQESSGSSAPDATVVDVLCNLPDATWQRVRATYARQTGPSA